MTNIYKTLVVASVSKRKIKNKLTTNYHSLIVLAENKEIIFTRPQRPYASSERLLILFKKIMTTYIVKNAQLYFLSYLSTL